VSRTRHIAALVAVCAVSATAAAASGEAGKAQPASASAQAFARQDASGARHDFVSVSGDGGTAGDATGVKTSTDGGRGTATATAAASDVDLFDGLVTAKAVRVRAEADGDGTATSGSIAGLAVEGRAVDPPTERTSYDLNGYGRLVALGSGPTGILGLRARLTKDYKGHKAGEVVRVAYASARVADAVRDASAPAQGAATNKPSARKTLTKKQRAHRALLKRHKKEADALFAAKGYAFPVAGRHSFTNDWGAPRQDTGTHEGNDVFAQSGTPVLAVADGRLYRVGTRKVPGNRVWLRDHDGHRFFYAHLSDFAAAAYNGADVHAGEVIGFVGSTGDAEQTPPHLHFEVHLGDGDPINPFRFLTDWERRGVKYEKDPGRRPGALVVVRDFLAES
jgi:murein DD-endopeptidase MepM/ murein hydrolase activator NlpD